MEEAILNIEKRDRFYVLDSSGNPVPGLVDGNFTRKLFRPDGTEVSGSISVTIYEIGFGEYEARWTMNVLEVWTLIIYHATYRPDGWRELYYVRSADLSILTEDDVWTNATRTLTAGTKDTEIDAIKAKTDNLPVDPTSETNATTNASSILLAISSLNNLSSADIQTACDSAITNNISIITIKGLSKWNMRIDTIVYNANNKMTSGRLSIYPTGPDVDADTNAIDRFTVSGEYIGQLLSLFKVTE